MKVVLFCGGLGTRLREYSDTIPKPLVNIGYRPILWHLMKYYASYGHKEFVLCLGYRGDMIKDYFLNYNEYTSNDFVMMDGGRKLELYNRDIDDWTISFVDTGLHTNIGQRLKAAAPYLAEEEMFLANYSDGLSDLPLNDYIEDFRGNGAVASFVSVRPSQSFHAVSARGDGRVTDIRSMQNSDFWINGGFFAFRRQVFEYLREDEDLVEQPFLRLIQEGKLMTRRYTGFWASMDTFKDKMMFDDLHARGEMPWKVWAQDAKRAS